MYGTVSGFCRRTSVAPVPPVLLLERHLEGSDPVPWQIPTRDCSWHFRCRAEQPRPSSILPRLLGYCLVERGRCPPCCTLRSYQTGVRLICGSAQIPPESALFAAELWQAFLVL